MTDFKEEAKALAELVAAARRGKGTTSGTSRHERLLLRQRTRWRVELSDLTAAYEKGLEDAAAHLWDGGPKKLGNYTDITFVEAAEMVRALKEKK